MDIVRRPAARVLCLDDRQHILLLRWRDPTDGRYIWEPPGGGIEPGEQPIDAARRELREETGLSEAGVTNRHVMVPRDFRWNGSRYVGEEAFFLGRFQRATSLTRTGLEQHESIALDQHAWMHWQDIELLPDEVEPPEIVAILCTLDPTGPWNRK